MRRGWHSAIVCGAAVFALAAACSSEDEFTSTPVDGGPDGATGGSSGSGGSNADASDSAAGTGGGSDATVEVCSDADSDGVTDCDGDCDDNDPLNYPGNSEICGDEADNDCDQAPDQVCGGLGTYVSAATGNDANPGTKALPVQTVSQGILNGETILGQAGGLTSVDVYVAEGHYAEKVTLVEGVSLLGGFSCNAQPCTWTRDPQQYESLIKNADFEGVLADFTITKATRIDSFTIMGLSGDTTTASLGTVGLTLNGGTPTVVNNTITGGDVTTGVENRNSFGIAVVAPSNDIQGALIDSNTVTGGIGLDISAALLMTDTDAAGKPYAVITRNTLTGGKAKSSRGVLIWASGTGTIIRDNDIAGGAGLDNTWGISIASIGVIEANRINTGTPPLGGNAASWSGGIESASSTSVIINNVIFGADAGQSAGVRLAELEGKAGTVILNGNYVDSVGAQNAITGSKSAAISMFNPGYSSTAAIIGRIANNILIASKGAARFGIYEAQNGSSKTVHPESLLNNDIFIANATQADALYAFWSGAAFSNKATIADVNGLAAQLGSVSGNISADPLADASWHLSSGSPCIDAGTNIDAPSDDLDGESRPKGAAFDIGPDEAQ